MIIDQLTNARLYKTLSPRIQQAFDYLLTTDLTTLEPGKYELDGSKLYAVVQQYTTRTPEQGKWEAHRKYIDLQYVANGVERIGYASVQRLKSGEYDESRDYLALTGDGEFLTVRGGDFMLLWPNDAHMPCMMIEKPEQVNKVVIKIALD